MKIYHLSDTHNKHEQIVLEEADIIIHSGDSTNMGELNEVIPFLNWFGKLPYSHKIFIAGNHDWLFELEPSLARELCKEHGVIWLNNEEIVIEGVKFYGTSDQPEFCNWSFNRNSEQLIQSYANIPEDTQVLITHAPPKGIRDYVINTWNPNGTNVGCPELNLFLPKLKDLKLHCFGHIHYSYGLEQIDGVWYSNGSICNEQYKPTNKGNVIELP